MARRESQNVKQAKEILRTGTATPAEMLALAKRLKAESQIGYARRTLDRAFMAKITDENLRRKIGQELALCTYKDADLPVDSRLDDAFEILKQVADPEQTEDQEVLGLSGAIHKLKWQRDGQTQHLERSLSYYKRGYEVGVALDYGYTSINAAFVLDLLAYQESAEGSRPGTVSETAKLRFEEARKIREDIVTILPPLAAEPDKQWLEKEWWFLVTIAEAYFGLGLKHYEDSLVWLKKAAALQVSSPQAVADWEYNTTARQLAHIARLQAESDGSSTELVGSPAWETLREFLGNNAAGVRTAFVGRIGLALSGGGFRASLFHIGVLARLAELDILRHVEVLSCVSGGSITGAYYYLEVRHLLQSKPDSEITREDYIEIVRRMEVEFLKGVQKNIRTRVASNPFTNIRMLFWPNYSRTERVGELLESEIFSRVEDADRKGRKERLFNNLFIQPAGEAGEFRPRFDNWRRQAKVPMLILNATTLNTGHNWQFTASWMGESPWNINKDIDANYRLRRMYYDDAPADYRDFSLGRAVAASACVPAIFDPLEMPGLYPGLTVRLVDGGVHDNQGVAGLVEQDCAVALVSDASGKTGDENEPSSGILGVSLRQNNLLMARVRESQYRELDGRKRALLLQGLVFLHLRKNLNRKPVDWINCPDPYIASGDEVRADSPSALTPYHVRRDIQERLAAIRTDLDSFTDAEAYALMTSGYRMIETEVRVDGEDGLAQQDGRMRWRFLEVEEAMKHAEQNDDFMKLLDVACDTGFRIWKLSPWLRFLKKIFIILAIAGLVASGLRWFEIWPAWLLQTPVLETAFVWAAFVLRVFLWWAGGIFLLAFLVSIVTRFVNKSRRFPKTLSQIVIGVLMLSGGWFLALLHLLFLDRRYLSRGELEKVKKFYARPEEAREEAGQPEQPSSLLAKAQ